MGDNADELADLRKAVRAFLEARSPESEVRRLIATESGYDQSCWAEMAEQIGLQGMIVPAEYGGSGATLVELAVVLEEMGRALLCAPFLSTTIATAALLATGDTDALARYLPPIADGSSKATIALAGVGRTDSMPSGDVVAEPAADGWQLTGTAPAVLDGESADLLLVVAPCGPGLGLFAVPTSAEGLRCVRLQVLDLTRRQATIILDRSPATLVGELGAAEPVVRQVRDFAAVALAAEQVGGARRCLEMAVGYARTRVQFGRTIGSFQAIKHKCADMLVEVESASSALSIAVDAFVGGTDTSLLASVAKASCSDAYVLASTENVQVHGGVGFTWEHPAHLYYRRARSTQVMFGEPVEHRARVAELLEL